MRPEKLLCFSHNVDLFTCPERVAHGVPVGILRDEAGEPLLVPCGRGGAPRQVLGITVGGVPLGEEDFEMEWMARRGATVAGYITSTREQLRHLPGHLWAIIFYCLQSRLDYWLRLLPIDITRRAAQAVDAALLSTVVQFSSVLLASARGTMGGMKVFWTEGSGRVRGKERGRHEQWLFIAPRKSVVRGRALSRFSLSLFLSHGI